jgi:hypothetical protein
MEKSMKSALTNLTERKKKVRKCAVEREIAEENEKIKNNKIILNK